MDASATPAIIAVGAVLAGVLLAPRALDAPPPVVREPVVRVAPVPTPGPVLSVRRGFDWKLDVTDDGTVSFVLRDRERRRDVLLRGPAAPALVPRLQALRERAGLVDMTVIYSCLRGPGYSVAQDYFSSAEPELHAEAAELSELIQAEMRRLHSLSDRVLLVSARRVEHGAGGGPNFEVEEVLHVAAGLTAPRPGARIRLEDDLAQRPHPERTVASGWEGKWYAESHSAEDARRILAWLAAHPLTTRPFQFDPGLEGTPLPPL